MSRFSDVFTQGGQTQLHKLHMIRQVIGSTLKGGLVIFVITFGFLIWMYHCWQDFWLLLCCFKAWIRVDYLTILPQGLFDESWLVDGNGVVHTVTDFHIRHSDFYQNLAWGICASFLKKCMYSLVISIVGFFLVSWFWVKMGRQKQQIKILSGFECVEPKILRKQILKSGSSSYSIANIPIPKNAEYQHMMITGTTGAGKSNMIHQLLEQIRKNGDQAIVLDTTGGIFSRFYDGSKDILMNPLDERSSHWNMWEEATNDHVIDEISESIIPDTRSMDSFWTQGARQLFGESVRFLKKNNCLMYDELLEMTLRMSLKDLHKYIGHTAVASLLDPSIEKTALSVRASLSNHMRVFDYLEDSENGLSLIKFMKENVNDWLFLSCQTDQRAFLKPIFSVWLSLIIKGMMTRQENNGSRTWIIIDELASLNKLPSLMTGLAEIRKYGGCFVLGFQDLSQVEDIYGHSSAKTLSNLTGSKVLFRAVDTDVATRVARYMGEQEKEELSTSISYGAHQMRDGVNLNQQRQVKAVVNASQIMLLQDLEAYVKFPGQFPVSKIKFDYLNIPNLNDVYKEKTKLKKEDSSQSEDLSNDVHETSSDEELSSNVIHPRFNKNNVIQGVFEHKKNKECVQDNLSFDLE